MPETYAAARAHASPKQGDGRRNRLLGAARTAVYERELQSELGLGGVVGEERDLYAVVELELLEDA